MENEDRKELGRIAVDLAALQVAVRLLVINTPGTADNLRTAATMYEDMTLFVNMSDQWRERIKAAVLKLASPGAKTDG